MYKVTQIEFKIMIVGKLNLLKKRIENDEDIHLKYGIYEMTKHLYNRGS